MAAVAAELTTVAASRQVSGGVCQRNKMGDQRQEPVLLGCRVFHAENGQRPPCPDTKPLSQDSVRERRDQGGGREQYVVRRACAASESTSIPQQWMTATVYSDGASDTNEAQRMKCLKNNRGCA